MSSSLDRAAATSSSSDDTPRAAPSSLGAWYTVCVLLGVYMNSFLDRQILALLVGHIKHDLNLSDAAVGFLMGPAFAVFYILAGLPLGMLADRMSRRWLIGIGQAAWSVASMSFGLGRNFGQLAAARIGVGVGEASLSPAAYSLVADSFPPHKLATALGVYGMGIYLGTGAAFLGGAFFVQWVYGPEMEAMRASLGPLFNELHPWQFVFFLIALPTVPLTLLLTTVREPARHGTPSDASFRRFFRYVREHRGTFFCHHLGFALLSFAGYGAVAWTPTYMARLHHWSPAEFGKWFGLVIIVAGTAGLFVGGKSADWLLARGKVDAKMRVGLYAAILWLPFGLAIPLLPDRWLAYAFMWPATFFSAFSWGIAPAAIQEVVPSRLRGQAAALYLFAINLLGLGLGPYLLGVVTDKVFHDDMQIHYSMLLTGFVANGVAIALLAAGLPRFRVTFRAYAALRAASPTGA